MLTTRVEDIYAHALQFTLLSYRQLLLENRVVIWKFSQKFFNEISGKDVSKFPEKVCRKFSKHCLEEENFQKLQKCFRNCIRKY